LEQPPAPPRSPLIFDIETDGLLDKLTRIHCISIHDPETGVTDGYPPHLVPEALRRLAGTERRLCGHNIIAFDIPAIQKLYPWFKPQALPLDTKVWSQLVTPDIWDLTQKKPAWRRQCPPQLADSHALKAWGYRLGVLKGETPDATWQTYSPEMLEYNKQDAIVTNALVNELQKWTTSDSAVDLEMQVACILVRQEQHGVCFDVKAAEKLAVQLADELQALKDQLQQYFPPWQRLVKRAISKVNNQKLGRVKGQEYEVWETIEFNPNSNPHIVKCLKDKYGWEPTVFTDKGNPQLDDEILADLDNLGSMPEVSLIRKYKTASKILGYVSAGANSWLNHVKNGRIHGNVQGCGAGTRRMTHNSPNLGQVPSVRAYLGKECRALFSPPLGYLMVGIDADQLELRTLSHFLFPYDGGEYAHAAIHGSKENKDDIHWRNAKAIGVDRDSGKTVFYA
jgi:DNA polymerase I